MTASRFINRPPLLAVFVGVIVLSAVFVLASVSDALAEPSPEDKRTFVMWFVPMIVGFLFLIISPFTAWYVYTGRKGLKQAKASESWPTTPGKILESGVRDITRRSRNGTSTTYWPFVRYEYTIGGTRHEADVIQFGMSEQGTLMKADAFVFELPVGKACTVHYNPEDPKIATLDTSSKSAQTRVKVGWFMLVLVPALGGVMIGLIAWFAT